MVETLMIKLGIKKTYTKEYFLGLLYHLIDNLTEQRLKSEQDQDRFLPKSKSEIKIFFWYISTPMIQKYANQEFAHEIMNEFRQKIIFSDIDEMEYSDEFIQDLLSQRFTFYNKYLSGKLPAMKLQDAIKTHRTIWFEKPFELTDPNKLEPLDFNFLESVVDNSKMQETTLKLVKEYRKRLKKMLKSTKQNVA